MKRVAPCIGTVASALCLAALGCNEPEPQGQQEPEAAPQEARAPVVDPITLLQATEAPELPGPLAKLRFGMSKEEARAAAPELGDGSRYLDEFRGALFGYAIDEHTGRLRSSTLRIDGADMAGLLGQAWGEPTRSDGPKGVVLRWYDAAEGLRATVSPKSGRTDEARFDGYLPVTKLLGEDESTLGFEAPDRPLLGATRKDLATHYADVLEVLTEDEAEKRRRELEKLTGEAPPTVATDLELPPTEHADQLTRVRPHFGDDGTIDRYRVDIAYGTVQGARDALLARFQAKWGEPQTQEKYGKTLLVFRERPRITVEDDPVAKAWTVELELVP